MSETHPRGDTVHRVQFTFDAQVEACFGRLALVHLAETVGEEMAFALVEGPAARTLPEGAYVHVQGTGHFAAPGLWRPFGPGGEMGPLAFVVAPGTLVPIEEPENGGAPCAVQTPCRAMTDSVWCEGHLVDPARPEWGYLGRGWRVDVAVPSAGDGTRAVLTFDPGHEDQTHRPAVKRGDTLAIKAMLTLYEQEYWSGITKDTPVLTVYRDKDYRVEASEHDS